MRKITSFILALALTLSLLVTAGAAAPGKVDLVITPRAEKVDGNVLFDIYLEPNNVAEIAAFQFAVTAQGGKIIGVAYLNNGKYTEDGTKIENPTNGGLVFYPDKVGAADFTNGYFEQFGGQRSSDDLTYKFVAAGTARAGYTDKDKNTSMPAHIWTTPTRTKIVTLTVQMDEGVTKCSLAADTTTSSKFSVGNWGSTNTVSDNGTTGTATSTLYTPASPTGVTVRGSVKSYNPGNQVTIRLLQGKGEKYKTTIAADTGSGQVPQDFSIANIAPGIYDLEVTKAAHLKYTIKNVEVSANAIALPDITLLCGDINNDGWINSTDLGMILQGQNYGKQTSTAGVNALTDLNGDGWVNSTDLGIVLQGQHYGKASNKIDFAG